jgi:hypothetical protein
MFHDAGASTGPRLALQNSEAAAGRSHTLANQTMLRLGAHRMTLPPSRLGMLQRECACGGGCPRCRGAAPIQPKLTINEPGDAYEQEADRIAKNVMRMPDVGPRASPSLWRVQRECAECEEHDKKSKLQTKRDQSGTATATAPPIVHAVLRSPGRPLDAQTRAFMEPRFGYDFGRVRVHTDERAARSAEAVNARAYTVGADVVFAHQQFTPATAMGRRLLAHELAHVVQQDLSATTEPAPSQLRRTVTVTPPAEVDNVLEYFNFMCPQNFTSDGQRIVSHCTQPSGPSCECLCDVASDPNRSDVATDPNRSDVASDPNRSYLIRVTAAAAELEAHFLSDGSFDLLPMPTASRPKTEQGDDPIVQIPATDSTLEFGSFDADGNGNWAPIWRILGHELCGHGRLKTDPENATEENAPQLGQDQTIGVENAIAQEHGEPARGFLADPRQGTSFWNIAGGDRSKVVFKLRDGLHHESPLFQAPPPIGDYPEPEPNQEVGVG